MNKTIHPIRFLAVVLAIAFTVMLVLFFAQPAHAQTVTAGVTQTTTVTADAPSAGSSIISSFITSTAATHPWLVTIASIMGLLRMLFKPIVSAFESYVKSTPSVEDDALVQRVEASGPFKAFAWCLDWFGSIKVGPQFTAKPEGKPEQG